jgi:beta-galactosidase
MIRERICLNGEWDFCPLKDPLPPETLPGIVPWDETKLRVPTDRDNIKTGLIRRSLNISLQPDLRAWLIFEAVGQRSVYFLNGKRIYASEESCLPVEFDISEHVRNGENELVAWYGPHEGIQTPAEAPCGPWQDVFLEYAPAVGIADIGVRTSTRCESIEVDISVQNRAMSGFGGLLDLRVLDGEQVVMQFSPLPVQIGLGLMTTLRMRENWRGARRWHPEDVNLYHLDARLVQDKHIIDHKRERFGFREVWLEGNNLLLNGEQIHLRSEDWPFERMEMQSAQERFRERRSSGVNAVVLEGIPYPSAYLAAADEAGMLIVAKNAISSWDESGNSDNTDFLRRLHEHWRAFVRRDRNHPSVIMWGLRNGISTGGFGKALAGLAQTIRDLDPSRPVR